MRGAAGGISARGASGRDLGCWGSSTGWGWEKMVWWDFFSCGSGETKCATGRLGEGRGGEEGRSRWAAHHLKKKKKRRKWGWVRGCPVWQVGRVEFPSIKKKGSCTMSRRRQGGG